MALKDVIIGYAKGGKGDTGTRGSRWTQGTAITGTSTTATIFPNTGITDALVNDNYINTSTGNTYMCTVAGAASTAKWVYTGNLKGPIGNKGDQGDTGPVASASTMQLTGYSKGTSAAAISPTDTANQAFGKLENQVETVNYLEPTTVSDTPPASGSKRSGLIGWIVAKIKALTTATAALNSNLLLINADSDTSEGSSFNKNFLLTGSATPGATPQRSAYFSKPADDTDWVNTPTAIQGKLWVGYRQVYRRSSVNILIRIIEMYPSDGRIWTNFYNNGTWKGWKSITPQ